MDIPSNTVSASVGDDVFSTPTEEDEANSDVQHFHSFVKTLESLFLSVKNNNEGTLPNYIPQLSRISPSKFAVAGCFVDGKTFEFGDSQDLFTVQSAAKPFVYLIAQSLVGAEVVHKHVGKEHSGQTYNAFAFDSDNLPHNPLINAGAISCCSLIHPDKESSLRYDYVYSVWRKMIETHAHPNSTSEENDLALGLGFDNSVFLSEKNHAHRNRALAYMMKENNVFPENSNMEKDLELYLQTCSMKVSCASLARAAAVLANSGTNPFTKERVFPSDHVRNCVALMYSCGMYDHSGKFAFSVGIPAKSGVSGAVILVIPEKLGICIWSPPLDKSLNPHRGVLLAQKISQTFCFHVFDNVSDKSMFLQEQQHRYDEAVTFCSLAAAGDLDALKRCMASAHNNVNSPDYDHSTPLHIAVDRKHLACVEFLLQSGADPNLKDRWGLTPYALALASKQPELVELFQRYANTTDISESGDNE